MSVERYAFDGEMSWARYDVHEGMFGDLRLRGVPQGW